jgi:predicted lipoprotein with Yx(FWY)xxD motif
MMTRNRIVSTLTALAALAGLASITACGGQPVAAARPVFVPAAATTPASPAPVVAKPVVVAKPTVAKVQKWVKIYSGPSDKNITPPKATRPGSHTIELNATPSDQIGTYVADGAGRTLYRFDKDSASPPKSNCNASCAIAWVPLLIKSPGKIYPKGVDPKILGYVERADHTCQVTIKGHPVYFFAGDAKPGDIDGQGVNGTWFAVSPTGGKTRPFPDSLANPGAPGN